ncbi:MAG: tetratricopeptide repeat protein [Limisphaerales bacterium]
MIKKLLLGAMLLIAVCGVKPVLAQVGGGAANLVDDKKAKALLDAGDARFDAGELSAAMDLYKAVLDRYPVSRWRFLARLKMGKQHLKEKKFDLALDQFRRVAVEENKDIDQRGDASLQVGICFFEMGKFEEAFGELRKVIKAYPGTAYSNDAYYYIGQAHFKMGRFANAIEAFKNVGTSIDPSTQEAEKLDAGKRLYVKIDDKDLSAQAGEAGVVVTIETSSGDKETVTCFPVTPGASVLMGSLRTQLGDAKPGDNIVQLIGTDKIKVTYVDKQTADAQLNVPRVKEIKVVGNARVKVVDGAFAESVGAVVLDKPTFLLVSDSDRDTSAKSDEIEVIVRTKRVVEENPDSEKAEKPVSNIQAALEAAEKAEPVFKVIDEKKVKLVEKPADGAAPGTAVHTGVFIGTISLARQGDTPNPAAIVAQVNDILEIEYLDEVSLEAKPVTRRTIAKVIEGNLNPLQVANAKINDEELKFKTALKTSEALKNIGNIYKELGLMKQSQDRYKQALTETEQVARSYGALNQRLLEQTYVQMWKIYYAMDDLGRAAQMCLELQRRFPESPFVDEALLLMGQVSQKQGKFQEAIGVFRRLAALKNSPLAPAAQYAIGECYEELGTGQKNKIYYDEAFLAFKGCFEKFPNSNQAGDALSKMAEYYYSKEDFTRALDLYEEALQQYQDSKFIDVVLYNYGRCLVKMKKLDDAVVKFNQLITSYPNSKMVANAQKIVEAIEKRKAAGSSAN